MKFVLATFSGVLTVLLGSAAAQNGEEACEGRGFNQQQCLDVGCCYWEEGGADAGCWSGVGQDSCDGNQFDDDAVNDDDENGDDNEGGGMGKHIGGKMMKTLASQLASQNT